MPAYTGKPNKWSVAVDLVIYLKSFNKYPRSNKRSPPIWMPKIAILSVSFGIPGTSINGFFKTVGENPIFLSGKILILLLYHIKHFLLSK